MKKTDEVDMDSIDLETGHILDNEGICWCNPVEVEPGVWVHNDRREQH